MVLMNNFFLKSRVILFGIFFTLSSQSCVKGVKRKVDFTRENEVIVETRSQLSDFFFDSSLFLTISADAPLEQTTIRATQELVDAKFLFEFQAVGRYGKRPASEFEEHAVINFVIVNIVTEASKRGLNVYVTRINSRSYNIRIGNNKCHFYVEVSNDGEISKLLVRVKC